MNKEENTYSNLKCYHIGFKDKSPPKTSSSHLISVLCRLAVVPSEIFYISMFLAEQNKQEQLSEIRAALERC